MGRPAFGIGPIGRVATTARPLPGAAGPTAPPPEPPAMPSATVATGAPTPGAFRAGWPDAGRSRPASPPNLRRNVCPHFYLTGLRGQLPVNAPHLLKGLVRRDGAVSRCQVRGGVHLDHGYVNDVCLSPRFNQCVFYEEALTSDRSGR